VGKGGVRSAGGFLKVTRFGIRDATSLSGRVLRGRKSGGEAPERSHVVGNGAGQHSLRYKA